MRAIAALIATVCTFVETLLSRPSSSSGTDHNYGADDLFPRQEAQASDGTFPQGFGAAQEEVSESVYSFPGRGRVLAETSLANSE